MHWTYQSNTWSMSSSSTEASQSGIDAALAEAVASSGAVTSYMGCPTALLLIPASTGPFSSSKRWGRMASPFSPKALDTTFSAREDIMQQCWKGTTIVYQQQ